jgi:hypothetical protein
VSPGHGQNVQPLEAEMRSEVKRQIDSMRTKKGTMKEATKSHLPQDIDAYIAQFPPDVQVVLQNIRATIVQAAPGAKEVISYQMPALKQHGILVYFAA